MTELLFQALVSPLFLLGQFIVAFSWQAAVVFSGLVALAVGGMLALNHGTKAPRWIFVPLLLAHVQVLVRGLFGLPAWWVVAVLTAASIGWLVWKCRETPVAGLMLAWFAAVYSGSTAVLIYLRG